MLLARDIRCAKARLPVHVIIEPVALGATLHGLNHHGMSVSPIAEATRFDELCDNTGQRPATAEMVRLTRHRR